MRVLITGAAGFIGSHVLLKLSSKHEVKGCDNFNDYYSASLKKERIENFKLNHYIENVDLVDESKTLNFFEEFKPEVVIHLAAQPGVRYSKIDPSSYIQNNIVATENVLRAASIAEAGRLVYASSSSVYGSEITENFKESNRGNEVRNLYALSKRFNEDRMLLQNKIETVGLRFFSVYGPWGRPDMAYFRIIGSVLGIKKFSQIGDGNQRRDYTYLDDVINSIEALMYIQSAPKVINIGGGQPVSLNEMKREVEMFFGQSVSFDETIRDDTEALATQASTKLLVDSGIPIPSIDFKSGIRRVCEWASQVDKNKYRNWLESSK